MLASPGKWITYPSAIFHTLRFTTGQRMWDTIILVEGQSDFRSMKQQTAPMAKK